MEKTQGARVKECVTLWRKLTVDLGIPHTYEGMLELKEEIDKYIKSGEPFKGEIEIPALGRTASVNFPRESSKDVTITLKVTTKSQIT
jgi:hypothetical protein